MSEELSLVSVIIYREKTKLFGLTYIVADSCCEQKITIKSWIRSAEVIAQLGNTKCVLQKSSDKAVVNSLGSTGFTEQFNELGIFYKELL